MVSLLIGVVLATGASTLYSLGIAVQALDARDASHRHTLRISLLAHLVTRARWLLGTPRARAGASSWRSPRSSPASPGSRRWRPVIRPATSTALR
jgi:hypothetical protein